MIVTFESINHVQSVSKVEKNRLINVNHLFGNENGSDDGRGCFYYPFAPPHPHPKLAVIRTVMCAHTNHTFHHPKSGRAKNRCMAKIGSQFAPYFQHITPNRNQSAVPALPPKKKKPKETYE